MTVEPMRIGLILHDFALGGSERIALRLAGAWAEAGHAVTVYVDSPYGVMREIVHPALRIVTPQRVADGSGRNLKRLCRWAGQRAVAEIDTLFLAGNTYFAALPRLQRMCRGKVRIVAKMSNVFSRSGRSTLANMAFRMKTAWYLNHADLVVAMSPALKAECAALPFLRSPVAMIAQPTLDRVPDRSWPPVATRDPDRICFVGRLEPQKNVGLLLEAIALLEGRDVRLDIVGDGKERPRLEELASRLNLSGKVSFRGFSTDVAEWIKLARLLVLPSRYEGYPAVLVEAASVGTPVVTTACTPAVADIVAPGRTGIVAGGDSALLAEAIAAGLDMEPDYEAMYALASRHVLAEIAEIYLSHFSQNCSPQDLKPCC